MPKLTLAPAPQLPDHLKQYVGKSLNVNLQYPPIDPKNIPEIFHQKVAAFQQDYAAHCRNIQDVVFDMKLNT